VVRKLTPLIKAEPENTAFRYQLAAAHVEHDEWELALAECDRIEQIAPGRHQLGYFRGRSLVTAQRWREALVPLDEFIKFDPSHQEALVWRARVYLYLKDMAKAAADYRKALEQSRNPEFHTEFAKALADHVDELLLVSDHFRGFFDVLSFHSDRSAELGVHYYAP
jgi:tetratricopeptide (TPR) repeat protein